MEREMVMARKMWMETATGRGIRREMGKRMEMEMREQENVVVQ